jgi:4-hydroxy-tetrahydrodipicolinate synthase
MFEGTHTAVVTPFTADNSVDYDAFGEIIDFQFANGIAGIVPVGTTGESPTLSTPEHIEVIRKAVEFAAGRGQVIAGSGANSTAEAIELTVKAEKAGATASLQVCPYYNKPSQRGIFAHFKAIAEATSLPIMLYSIPGRCVVQIDVETTAKLHAACPNIMAIKEAGGDAQRVRDLRAALPEKFEVLSGDDALTVDFMDAGGVGVVSVAGNLVPKVMSDMTSAMLDGRRDEAVALLNRYQPLFEAFLKLDTNPVPIKEAMALAGHCAADLRLPMVRMEAGNLEILRATLSKLGII